MRFWICYHVDYSFITVLRTWNKPVLILFNVDDLLRESEKHKRQMSRNQKVILCSMTEIGTLRENTERSPGHIISQNIIFCTSGFKVYVRNDIRGKTF